MNETPNTQDQDPNNSLTESDPFKEVLEQQDTTQQARQAQLAEQARVDAEQAAAAAKRLSTIRTGVATGVTLGTIAAVGGGFAVATGEHADQEIKQNQQWEEEATQNQPKQEFEKGLETGSVKIETPPIVDELPAPVQQGDTQLPTLEK